MCGVAFYSNPIESKMQCRDRVEAALLCMHHRGPDGQGVDAVDGAAAGHVRLSIIDLGLSRQPMFSPDGRYVLSFNGEIYNYKELRQTLSSRWSFKTEGDTEVVLAGLFLEGIDFLSKMHGMWAIVYWDKLKNKVLLIRDRVGKKPLYYHNVSGVVVVASEIPAIVKMLPDFNGQESSESRSYFFRHGFYPPGKTIYQDVHEVLPSTYVSINLDDGSTDTSRYWMINPAAFDGDEKLAQTVFKEKFNRALERRLVSDVEVGVLLSGGLDSSLILSSLVCDHGLKPSTFTVGFSDKSYDERYFAEKIARAYGVKNYSIEVGELDHSTISSLIRDHVGQPFSDPSIFPTYLAAKLAAEHVKVALVGDGADEVFCGYQRYQGKLIYTNYKKVPSKIRWLISNVIRILPTSHAHHSKSLVKKAKLFEAMNENIGSSTGVMTPKILPLSLEREYFPAAFHSGVCNEGVSKPIDAVSAMMQADMNCYLPQDILLKSDRASMASSVEFRSPFLDYELVEFAFSLPRQWHRRWFRGKKLLRAAAASRVPKEILHKRKQGFSVPLGDWFMGGLGESMLELLASVDDREVVDGARRLLLAHRRREGDYGFVLWALFTYGQWFNSVGQKS